ncbi:hypothetical protein NGR_b08160 (plasmid) [Sinorhizobium fredii NGR234]|uniref:Uncharacterized protein n=1 Tax=Sinorhizobium fredii (strain NBRC 101917 / NGR234) TaxID=394 RepID=C3KQB4_SINFN|nr:hypothetical protein NGR_b08160 [Sinorhizobium fredii NGR234]
MHLSDRFSIERLTILDQNRFGIKVDEVNRENASAVDLITDLPKVAGPLVIARHSSFAYEGKQAVDQSS